VAVVDADGVLRAAGGVVWRPAPDGPQTCLVHRPRYDDWSLPKGKLTPGEHPLAGAVREVAEETAVQAIPQVRLPTVRYRVRDGLPKAVDYWLMRARQIGDFEPNDEVDDLRWTPLAGAADLVSYDHDADVLRHAAGLPPVTAVVLLIRHGYAGEREDWPGPDEIRPLDDRGVAEARELAELLLVFAPQRLVSATPDRCRQTLLPLAVATGVPIEIDPSFDETADPARSTTRLQDLATGGVEPVVICSQGKLIPRVVAQLTGGTPDEYATPKGSGWMLGFSAAQPVGTDRISPVSLG
jgi:8-oxo-dGTP diphosphatase